MLESNLDSSFTNFFIFLNTLYSKIETTLTDLLIVNLCKMVTSETKLELKKQLFDLVKHNYQTKLIWAATVLAVKKEDIEDIVLDLDLFIRDSFIINPNYHTRDLAEEERELLDSKPAPTFCDAKKSH